MQPDFTLELLKAGKSAGIHVAIETNMTLPWKITEPVVRICDLVMMDIKMLQEALHIKWTGAGNSHVLDNLINLSVMNKPVIVRTPVIPSVNDQADEIGRIAEFLSGLENVLYYELLPYHPLGQSKQLGEEAFKTRNFEKPKPSKMLLLAAAAKDFGIKVLLAGKEI